MDQYDDYQTHPAQDSDFLHQCLMESYVDLEGDQGDDWNRHKIFGKIEIVKAALLCEQPSTSELTYGIITKPDRSKLIMLIMGLRHRLMMRALRTLERYLDGDVASLKAAGMDQLKIWIDQLMGLVKQVIASKNVAYH